LEDRRNVGENSCNYGDETDQTGPILNVYDDDDDDDDDVFKYVSDFHRRQTDDVFCRNLKCVVRRGASTATDNTVFTNSVEYSPRESSRLDI